MFQNSHLMKNLVQHNFHYSSMIWMPAEFFWNLQIGSIKRQNPQTFITLCSKKTPLISREAERPMLRTFENTTLGCFFFLFSLPYACLLDPYRARGQRKHHHERRGVLLNFPSCPYKQPHEKKQNKTETPQKTNKQWL